MMITAAAMVNPMLTQDERRDLRIVLQRLLMTPSLQRLPALHPPALVAQMSLRCTHDHLAAQSLTTISIRNLARESSGLFAGQGRLKRTSCALTLRG